MFKSTLKLKRLFTRLSQKELAALLQMNQMAIQRAESGEATQQKLLDRLPFFMSLKSRTADIYNRIINLNMLYDSQAEAKRNALKIKLDRPNGNGRG